MAEVHLDKQGYPRPAGYHSVLFFPGSMVPRGGTLIIIAIVFIIVYFLMW